MKELSIVIVTYNSEDTIIKCLESIFKFTKDIQFEIIVVDNDSKDKTTEQLEKFKDRIKLIKNHQNLGFAKANNYGAKESEGEILLFLNPDTEIIDDSITKLFQFIKNHKDISIAGPLLLNSNGRWQMGHVTLTLCQKINYFIFKRPYYKVKMIVGAALMMGKKDFFDLNGFDENFFLLFEDTDLCLRARRAGKKLALNMSIKVKHTSSNSFSDIKQYTKFYKKSFEYYLNKNFHGIEKIYIWIWEHIRMNWIKNFKKI